MTFTANPFCFGAWPSCHSWSAPCLAEFFRCPSSSAARPSSSSTRSPRAATPRSSSSSRGGLTQQHPPSLPFPPPLPPSFILHPPSSLPPYYPTFLPTLRLFKNRCLQSLVIFAPSLLCHCGTIAMPLKTPARCAPPWPCAGLHAFISVASTPSDAAPCAPLSPPSLNPRCTAWSPATRSRTASASR